MAEMKFLKFEETDGIARITFSRPKHNVFNIEMMNELNGLLDTLMAHNTLKCVVFFGEGPSWCAGVEVGDHKPEMVDEMVSVFNGIFERVNQLDVPTIAAVHGLCVGGGMEMAIACDIVMASEGAKFGQPEVKLGFFPPYAVIRLPELIGPAKTIEVCTSGKIYTAYDAQLLGFVGHVIAEDGFAEAVEKNFSASLLPSQAPSSGLIAVSDASRVVDALRLIPHGVKAMSTEIEGVVDTSMNFAVLRTEESQVKVLTNRRSAVMSRGADFSETMFGLARLYGGTYETGNQYPPWEPQSSSDILDRGKRIWKELFGNDPEVEVTHAGLECGAIGSRYPGLDMISFGPTILQPHSPDERMLIPSVGRVRTFFRELLKSYKG